MTIAARNYLPYVRVLAASFQQWHPESVFTALLVDARDDETFAESFDVVSPSDLSIPGDDLARMTFMYDVTELCTALKPWALERELDEGADVAVYLDPDIKLYADLGATRATVMEHGVALVPHRLTPMPRDGLRPSETDIMEAGIFNLGFCAVGADGRPFLRWWQQRLRTDAISDPVNALFTDQRWVDWVPALFRYKAMRDPGLNVAYWNLDERHLQTSDGGKATCGPGPLRFFHYSGYRTSKPWSLSKYVADNPRILISEYPQLRVLLDDYAADLSAQGVGRGDVDALPYRFGRFPDDVDVPHIVRRHYRRAYLDAIADGSPLPPVPDPWTQFANLQEFFDRPASDKPVLTELASLLWRTRPDLMVAFPRPEHADFAAYQRWLAAEGVRDKAIPRGWGQSATDMTPRSAELVDIMGVNLFGYFSSELGLGESGRLLLRAVEGSNVAMTTHVSVRNASPKNAMFTERSPTYRYPINLVAINADHFIHWHEQWGDQYSPAAYTIGVWAWELESFPAHMLSALQYVDEVWAVSDFVAGSLRPMVDVPVKVFRHPAQPQPRQARPDFLRIDEKRPYFGFAFDYFSEAERKNPAGLIEAFKDAFPNQDGPALVIKSMNGSARRTAREKVRAAAAGRADVVLVDEYVSRQQMQGFIQHAMAFVSLHRSEGFGLGMFEAMSNGVPVIATGYSGNLEFMSHDNSILLPYDFVPTGADSGPYAGLGHWADPDRSAAAGAMHRVAQSPGHARELGMRAQADVLENFSVDLAAEFARSRLRDIFRERLVQRVPSSLRRGVPFSPPPETADDGCRTKSSHRKRS